MITITETLYKKMPDDIKACFKQLPNPSSEEAESRRFNSLLLQALTPQSKLLKEGIR